MRRLFTLFTTFALLLSLTVSCGEDENGIVDPNTEEGSDNETGDDDGSDVILVSDVTAPTTTTPHLYKSTDGGTDLYIYHVATEAALVGEPKAAIIFFHGGGWSGGSYTTFLQHCEYLATQGIVGFTAQYRVTGSKVEDVSILDCLRDARSAVRWVKANAEQFNVDPEKIITGGGSAGGCLAAGISLSDEGIFDSTDDTSISLDIAANVLFNPVVHNVSGTNFGAYNASGVAKACEAESFAVTAFSPFSNVTEGVPPTILLLGENDEFVPSATAIEYQRMIEEVNGTCVLGFHENKAHSFYNFYVSAFGESTTTSATGFTATMPYVHDFLREQGFINDNSSQVVDWLTYGGYNNYVYVDNYFYDNSNSNVAADYAQWCSDNNYSDMPTLGTNLVTNGDFESGDYEGWMAQNDANQSIASDLSYVIDGDYSLLSSGSWQKFYQEIEVVPGVRYYFGFEGRHTKTQQEVSGEGTVNTGTFQLSLRTSPLDGNSQIVTASSINSNEDVYVWSSTAFESNITSVFFTLSLEGGFGTSDNFFFAMSKEDEETLYGSTVEGFDPLPEWTPESEEPIYEGNMLINGDFETGLTSPWVCDAGAEINTVTESYAINGYYSLLITTSWPRVYQVVQVEGGKKYKYGFKGRQLSAAGVSGGTSYGSGQRVSVSVKTGGPQGTAISNSEIGVYGAGTDTSKNGTFTVPSGTTEIYFMINSSGGYAYIDSVYMQLSE
ncbi:MAG: alpha/beta hydrolase fold domain-containing protein [Rikenellaceae bacterium]